jgi:hypothetical protein
VDSIALLFLSVYLDAAGMLQSSTDAEVLLARMERANFVSFLLCEQKLSGLIEDGERSMRRMLDNASSMNRLEDEEIPPMPPMD